MVLGIVGRLDRKVSKALYWSSADGLRRGVLRSLEFSGDGLIWLQVPFIAWATSMVPLDKTYCLVNLLIGFLLDLCMIGLLKFVFRRPRPVYNKDDMHIVVSVDKFSFPSGHSSRAMFIAAMAYICIPSSLRYVVMTWSAMTAMSRVILGRHYLGDVSVGCCLGVALAAALSQGTFKAEHLLYTHENWVAHYGTILARMHVKA
mmetsp:Transcript_22258/g.37208  ORF Transcript_22258/g.37208 Transcript_22258/m.37208 type:complete len:203 (+) Transcript_22258:131-739(+)|eukprot:CAMPEP_0198211844 /NCGR_PEP_ID=MMETSP1445-20131203/25377_1 /TAXON_ID=36898 /ORGANISM="Pyramimonas sp., Strain CCMP2087" /LENGTH=202 /DNA_ID=CAMNT_0043886191 /DNA_START=131 /DNA_END=739 /DNA_ORIENTATION=+